MDIENARESDVIERINAALLNHSDKDWNYSRISLVTRRLDDVESPYILNLELLDQKSAEGRGQLKTLTDEVKWGDRHSSELGVLEIVSLRINKALLAVTSNEYWNHKRPVVRIIKRQPLGREPTTNAALWYQITEVAGEEFDNR